MHPRYLPAPPLQCGPLMGQPCPRLGASPESPSTLATCWSPPHPWRPPHGSALPEAGTEPVFHALLPLDSPDTIFSNYLRNMLPPDFTLISAFNTSSAARKSTFCPLSAPAAAAVALVGMCKCQGHNRHCSHLSIANDLSAATHPAPITVPAPLSPPPLVATPVPPDQAAAPSMSSQHHLPPSAAERVVKRWCNAKLRRDHRGETNLLLSCL